MTERPEPELTVVVVAFVGAGPLERCLEALAAQAVSPPPDIVVPHDASLGEVRSLQARFPDVRWVRLEGDRTPAELRAAGVARARTPLVALLEDHCIPEPDWCARVVEAHRGPHAAVGGAVEKGFPPGRDDDTALDWAFYLADYSRYMPPMRAGPAAGCTDCNVSYKRDALWEVSTAWGTEFHENVVHAALRARGRTLWFDPRVLVREQRSLTVRDGLRDRYAFGRLFGSTRVEGAPLGRRLAHAAAAAVLPPLLVARVARTVWTRGRHRGAFVRALPALAMISCAWLWGEAVGALTATPAASLRARGATA